LAPPGAEQQINDGSVAGRAGVGVHPSAAGAAVAAALELVEGLDRSTTFLTVRTWAAASARTCGAGSGSGVTFLVGSPWRGACALIQVNSADRCAWSRGSRHSAWQSSSPTSTA
jgi:hypothetical protein